MRRWSGKGKCRKRDASSKCGTRNYYPLFVIFGNIVYLHQKGTAYRKDSNFHSRWLNRDYLYALISF